MERKRTICVEKEIDTIQECLRGTIGRGYSDKAPEQIKRFQVFGNQKIRQSDAAQTVLNTHKVVHL
ncbi:MAG: hypothetical protein LUG57_10490 [Oscillospiraceae bacterium]|nr:hypothetical protein [Oscillospiraceae bacterium]